MAASLTDLGFQKGVITETVISTCSSDGEPNAAPMGVSMQDAQHLTVDIFNSSQTVRNIKANRCAMINLTSDIEVFYHSTFKETNPANKLPTEWFKKAEKVKAPRLRLADASIEVTVERLQLIGTGKTRVVFKVESIHATRIYPQTFNRAFSLTIEAIIYATRVKVLSEDPTQQNQTAKLQEKIVEFREIVGRAAPNSSCMRVMDDLVRRVEGWRKLR